MLLFPISFKLLYAGSAAQQECVFLFSQSSQQQQRRSSGQLRLGCNLTRVGLRSLYLDCPVLCVVF